MAVAVMKQRSVEEVAVLQSPWQRRNLSTSSCIPMNFKIPGVNIHRNLLHYKLLYLAYLL
jgi:hypothetical protein